MITYYIILYAIIFFKVFRLQRKTLSWLYCFFFLIIIIIKVFNGKPYSDYIVSFYYYSSKFLWARFLRDGWMDLNEIWHEYESLYEVYRKCRFSKNSLPVRSYRRFTFKNIDFCPGVFSETARDNWVKLSGIVDLSSLWLLVVTGSDRKNRKFQTFSFKLKPIPLYKVSHLLSKNVDTNGSRSVNFR